MRMDELLIPFIELRGELISRVFHLSDVIKYCSAEILVELIESLCRSHP